MPMMVLSWIGESRKELKEVDVEMPVDSMLRRRAQDPFAHS